MRNSKIDFVLNVAKFYTILAKRLDAGLGWLSFNDFIVLYYLNETENQKLRRIDLAEKVWLTASGITRLLLPMEKIWLITKEINWDDARVSLVSLAPGWKRKLEEAWERFDLFADEIIGDEKEKIEDITKVLQKIWGRILWK